MIEDLHQTWSKHHWSINQLVLLGIQWNLSILLLEMKIQIFI